jgi:hypothetical protein
MSLLMQVQAYQLAIEQHRNFELRVPVNANIPGGLNSNNPEALLHSGSGSFRQTGSADGPLSLTSLPGAKAQQGAMHGVRSWGSSSRDSGREPGSSTGTPQQQAAAADAAGPQSPQQQQQAVELSAQQAAVLAATAAAAERSHPPHGDVAPRRRSIGGGMRYIRFQFRSVSSVGSHMAPAVSVPPALVSMERTNYYWGTVDMPASSNQGDSSDWQGGYTFGASQVGMGCVLFTASGFCCCGFVDTSVLLGVLVLFTCVCYMVLAGGLCRALFASFVQQV